jgi:hypothetical protein
MVAIVINQFGGMSSKISPRLLPDNMSQYAENIDFSHGTFTPLRNDGGASISPALGSLSGNTETIFRTKAGAWLAFDNDVDVVESPVSGDTYDRVYLTGYGGYPQITSSPYSNVYKLGLQRPTAPSVDLNPDPSANVSTENPVSRAYLATLVTDFGEEGPPSLVTTSQILDVYTDQTISVEVGNPPTGRNYAYIRVYRTDEDGTFRFLAQVAATESFPFTFTDSAADSALGEEVPSSDWVAPDDSMVGLTAMPNGITAGFFGQTLCFSEAFLPHAWPEAYQLTTAYPIVGLSRTDTGLIVLTEGKPYMVQGADPAGMVMTELDIAQSCVSKKSIVDMGGSVIYASPDGLVGISGSGSAVLTESILEKYQWYEGYNPTGLIGFRWEDRYVGFSVRASNQPEGFIFDPRGGQNAFSQIDRAEDVVAGFNDLTSDELYLIKAVSGADFTFGSGSSWVAAEFRSKHFFTRRPINFAVCQVAFGSEYANGTTTVEIKAGDKYPNATPIHTETIASTEDIATFRLPSGFKNSVFQVTVTGNREIASITLAESPREIT